MQAFSTIQRAVREVHERLSTAQGELASMSAGVEERLRKRRQQAQAHGRAMREEAQGLVAEVDALISQMQSELQPAISEQSGSLAALGTQVTEECTARRAVLTGQQSQIDTLAAEVQRQQGMISGLPVSGAAQLGGLEATLAQLLEMSVRNSATLAACRQESRTKLDEFPARVENAVASVEASGRVSLETAEERMGEDRRRVAELGRLWDERQAREEAVARWRASTAEAMARAAEQSSEARLRGKAIAAAEEASERKVSVRVEEESRQLADRVGRGVAGVKEEALLSLARKVERDEAV